MEIQQQQQSNLFESKVQINEEFSQMLAQDLQRQSSQKRIQKMLKNNEQRYNIDLDDLREENKDLAKYIIKNPQTVIQYMERQLQDQIEDMQGDQKKQVKDQKGFVSVTKKVTDYKIGIQGNLGENHINPRGLNANKINQLLSCKGIVTRISLIRPKLVRSVHYCQKTKKGTIKKYHNEFNLAEDVSLKLPNGYPLTDIEGNPLETEFGFSKYKDLQTIILQEMPEKAPTGKLPRSIEVVISQDLCDEVKPGDRVAVTGVYKAMMSSGTKRYGTFRQQIIATNIRVLNKIENDVILTTQDIKEFRKVSNKKDLFSQMSRSIGPSIQGHENIKKGILLMLVGGQEKNLENGAHLRGDVNILMVGDPGTAKSQFLRTVINMRPGTINTTGRGSSGVGLTAAVVWDNDSNTRQLEAGAMVLGDRGIVCIDEFDKMNESDRVAIHEVMEQQTVTIAKAGMHTTLNARCSVIAAANPIYGEYQTDISPAQNIALPDSLMSRFDLIFVVLDEKDEKKDRKIATKVTNNHRYKNPHQKNFLQQDNESYDEPSLQLENEEISTYEKYNVLTHSSKRTKIFSKKFLQKYLYYAKQIQPKLTQKACECISKAWTSLRNKDMDLEQFNAQDGTFKVMPITIRTLESLIRLATSHAKLRLSKKVTEEDCLVAADLLNKSLFSSKSQINDIGEEFEEELQNSQKSSKSPSKRNSRRSSKKSTPQKQSVKKSPKKKSVKKSPRKSARKSVKKSPSKSKKSVEKLTSEFQVMNLKKDKTDEAEETMDKFFMSREQVNPDNIKFVFKKMVEYSKKVKNESFKVEALWEFIKSSSKKSDKGRVQNKQQTSLACQELEEKGKIMKSDIDVYYIM